MLGFKAAERKEKLPAHNNGKPLRGVKITMRDEQKVIGLLERKDVCYVYVRVADKHIPRRIPITDISFIEEIIERGIPHNCGFNTIKKNLGGLGLHYRRETYPDSERGDVGGFIGNIEGEGRLETLHDIAKTFTTVRFLFEEITSMQNGLLPCIVPGKYVPHFVARLAQDNFLVEFPNVRRACMMANSLNRVYHQYAQQFFWIPPEDVGGTRSLWRFKSADNPTKKLVCSWQAWARNVADEIEREGSIDSLFLLEMPLRFYVCKEIERRLEATSKNALEEARQKANEFCMQRSLICDLEVDIAGIESVRNGRDILATLGCETSVCDKLVLSTAHAEIVHAISELKENVAILQKESVEQRKKAEESKMSILMLKRRHSLCRNCPEERYFVLKALSQEQSMDAIDAFHAFYYMYGLLDDDERELKKAKIFHLPQTTGHMVQWTSAYRKSGENIGNGEKTRYKIKKPGELPNRVRNKLKLMPDGTLVGKGKQRYKGRFIKEDAYKPRKQLVRTGAHEAQISQAPLTMF